MNLEKFKEEIQKKKTILYIPLYQRNYKWSDSEEEKNGAGKLIKDIIKNKEDSKGQADFNLGMITTYIDKKKRIQILDGQQRLITLSLIMNALGKANEEDWIKLQFERDPGFDNSISSSNSNSGGDSVPRYNFIYGNERNDSVDVRRMWNNLEKIGVIINPNSSKEENPSKEDLYKYIMEHVKILHHETTREPIDEFLNMNFNKTPFCAADYIKANMIFDTIEEKNTDEDKKQEITIKDIMNLWKKLQYSLYQLDNVFEKNDSLENDMFQLIKQHYIQLEKNRMEILFEDRYYKKVDKYPFEKKVNCDSYYDDKGNEGNKRIERLGREYCELEKSYKIMQNLLEELIIIDAEGNYHPNYTAYSAYNLLCQKNSGITFFKMFDGSEDVGKTLYKTFNLTEESYYKLKNSMVNVNQFMEAMLISNNTSSDNSYIRRIAGNKSVDIENFEKYKKVFDIKFSEFTDIINQGKKEKGQLFSTDNKTVTLRDILSSDKIKQVKVPQIQRDYVMGSNQRYLECYLTKMRFEELCQKGELLQDKCCNDNKCISQSIEDNSYDITDNDINCLYKKIVINRGREDLPNAENIEKNYFEEKLIPKICKPNESGRECRFNEIKRWLEIIGKNPIKKPENFMSYRKGTVLGDSLELRNKIIEEMQKLYQESIKKKVDYKNNKKKMNTSCIMGHIDEHGTFWVYDGQQRITTSIILLAYGLKKANEEVNEEANKIFQIINKFSFEGRDGANQILKTIIMQPSIELEMLQSFIEDNTSFAIYKFWDWLNASGTCSDNDWREFREISPEFILDGMDFELVLMEQVEAAEQLFMEMNEGLALTPEEKYKAELNYVMNEIDYLKRKCFSRKMDNEWLDKCQSEELEVRWLQHAITMAYFEVNGYDGQRNRESLVGLNSEILDFVMDKLTAYLGTKESLEKNCPSSIEKEIESWCSTLALTEKSEYYSDRIKLNLTDFQELLSMIFKFKSEKTKGDYYAECFRLISKMRNNKCLTIKQEEVTLVESNNKNDAEKLVYNLLKNRQERYNFYNVSLWENEAGDKYDDKKFHENDFWLKCEEKINYELSELYFIDIQKFEMKMTEKDILNQEGFDLKCLLGTYDNAKGRKKVKFHFLCSDFYKDRIMEYTESCRCKGVFINGIRDVMNSNDDSEKTSEDIYEFELELKAIVTQINECFEELNDEKKQMIYQLGIERGYYRVNRDGQNGEICIEDRRNKQEDASVCPFLENKLQIPGLENWYSNKNGKFLLFVLNNCAESMKDQIKKEIVDCYLKNPKMYSNYAYQTKKYLKEKCDNNCQNCCENCSIYTHLKKDTICQDEILRVLPENMVKKLGIEECWNEHSGINHFYNETGIASTYLDGNK